MEPPITEVNAVKSLYDINTRMWLRGCQQTATIHKSNVLFVCVCKHFQLIFLSPVCEGHMQPTIPHEMLHSELIDNNKIIEFTTGRGYIVL